MTEPVEVLEIRYLLSREILEVRNRPEDILAMGVVNRPDDRPEEIGVQYQVWSWRDCGAYITKKER